MPAEMDWAEADLAIKHPRSQWAGMGRHAAPTAAPLPADAMPASLLLPMGRHRAGLPRLSEFRRLHAVEPVARLRDDGRLFRDAARRRAARARRAAPRRRAASRCIEVQKLLQQHGHDVGKVDGIIGAQTRAAVKAVQPQLGLPAEFLPRSDVPRRAAEDVSRAGSCTARRIRSPTAPTPRSGKGGDDPRARPRRDAGKHPAARRRLRPRRHPLSRAARQRQHLVSELASSRRSRRTSRGSRRRSR